MHEHRQPGRGKMSQQDNQEISRKAFPIRSVILIALVVSLGAGAAAYGLANVFASSNPSQQSTQTNTSGQQWLGLAGHDPQAWQSSGSDSYLTFRALSTVNNVTVTGFSIIDNTHLGVNLAYHGTGTAPALTIVALAPGLSGSNTLSAGWGASTTTNVGLLGQGTLSTTTHIRVLIVPFTGP